MERRDVADPAGGSEGPDSVGGEKIGLCAQIGGGAGRCVRLFRPDSRTQKICGQVLKCAAKHTRRATAQRPAKAIRNKLNTNVLEPATSRHQPREVDQRLRLSAAAVRPKMELYGEMMRDLLSDQISAAADPSHRRLVDETNGVSALRYAVAAHSLADGQARQR